ncbi:unnamed protein product [Nippostrongylus brasiliensis]|uniref:Uncharacterized protein n=1 Tax=Nippostrongylus brasiliensis TaxID=27835 RepID=A0A0N4XY06_NIPBR|nr:hypothetical protein Q1695_011942 [Nippostrongylus brasiliensis]VDL71518.1 unnamed protein product [Nippostrongylus brasiliensis]
MNAVLVASFLFSLLLIAQSSPLDGDADLSNLMLIRARRQFFPGMGMGGMGGGYGNSYGMSSSSQVGGYNTGYSGLGGLGFGRR